MEALHDIVKAGKVRYLGASSMHAWQFAKLQHAADLHGWTRFVSMQNQYNLLRRQDAAAPRRLRPHRRSDQAPSPAGLDRSTGPAPHRRRDYGLEEPYTPHGPSWF